MIAIPPGWNRCVCENLLRGGKNLYKHLPGVDHLMSQEGVEFQVPMQVLRKLNVNWIG